MTGIMGYMIIEEMSFLQAFYTTMITVSTVGFSDSGIVTDEGKLFTIVLIILSFGTFAYALSSISNYLLDGEYRVYFKDYQMNKEVEKLEGHVIVCGYGRVGTQAVNELSAHSKQYVIVEQSADLLESFRLSKEHLFIEGDATFDEVLQKAQINQAEALITTLPSDAHNLFVVLSARELNPNLKIISRASEGSSVKKLKIAGANNVIMPDSLGGAHMASLVTTPDVIEFLDHITIQGQSQINLEEINFENIPDGYKNKTIGHIASDFNTGCNIVGFKTPEGDFVVNPKPETLLVPGSKLFVLGNPQQIGEINKIFGIQND